MTQNINLPTEKQGIFVGQKEIKHSVDQKIEQNYIGDTIQVDEIAKSMIECVHNSHPVRLLSNEKINTMDHERSEERCDETRSPFLQI